MPLNTACLVAMLLLVTAFGRQYWTTFTLDLPSFVAALFLVQSWGAGSATTWNLPAWSLSAEWLAYAAFPVTVIVVAQIGSRRLAAAGWLVCLSTLAILMARVGGMSLDHTWLLGLPRCLLQFVAGMMLWRWMRLGAVSPRAADACLIVGAALLALAIGVPRLQLVAPFAFSALIVACAGRGRWADRLMGGRAIEFLGEISFSLYLSHFVLLGLFVFLAAATSVAASALAVRLGFAGMALASVYAVSWVTWRWVELPGQAAGRRFGARRSAARAVRSPAARAPQGRAPIVPIADREG